jgi:hypothetical protein
MGKTTWRKELQVELKYQNESWEDIESSTMTDADLDRELDDGCGLHQGCAFTVWTARRVYFPAVYDGSEWVESVSRNPDGKPTMHVGSE